MDFVAVVDQAIALLRQRGRLTYRTLQRQFTVDRLPGGLSAWDMRCISNQWQCLWYEKLSRQPVVGHRHDAVFLHRKALVKPFGITRYYTDSWSASTRHLAAEEHQPGKYNTQQRARQHLTVRPWRKRLVRTRIGFSRSIQMHDMGLGSFTHR